MLGRVNNESAGQTRKAACFGIDGLDCFNSLKLLHYDARNVSLFVLFRI